MSSLQDALDERATDVPYESLARSYREFDRPPGSDPIALLASAAAATTGQNYETGVLPALERFRDSVIETGVATTYDDLAAMSPAEDPLPSVFPAERKRRVLLEGASVLANRREDDDLEALKGWAAEADVYRYDDDPIGAISGVGPASFQFLRQLAGIETAKPDPALESLLSTVADVVDGPAAIDTTTPLRTMASCEWASLQTSYTMLEIDRLAWWLAADETTRESMLEA